MCICVCVSCSVVSNSFDPTDYSLPGFSVHPWNSSDKNTGMGSHDTTLMAENEEELRSLLMKVKKESEKAGIKFNIQKTKIMASGPITSWQIVGETMDTVSDFIFLGSKITQMGTTVMN